MRLVPFLLTVALAGSLLGAQAPGKLPWDTAPMPPWKAGDWGPLPAPARAAAVPADAPLQVRITPDGAVRIIDDRGMILLRTGLPGRPVRAWRDGGAPVPDFALVRFPARSPLSRGVQSLPLNQDFRPGLEGLLWLLGDDGKFITLIHPATARLAYLPLPSGRNFRLVFHPDRLEVREGAGGDGQEECWSMPWIALLSQLIHLGQENPANRPSGTALLPFPRS